MFEGETYHENLSDEEIVEIEKIFIDNGKYKEIISLAQAIIPDGGIT